MKLKLIFVMTLLLVISSCSKDNDALEIETPQEIVTDRPAKISAAFPDLKAWLIISGVDVNYTLEYDSEGRVSKRNGYVFSGNIMYPPSFSNSAYTSISYTGNTAVMKNYKSTIPNERKFEFDNKGRVAKLIIPFPIDVKKERHITYSYNTSGKLMETLTEFPNATYDPTNPNDYILTYVEKFTYNNMGNMVIAVTKEKHNNTEVYTTREVKFENFDTTPNPFRKLGIFEDYFYYSLSNNNAGKVSIMNYNKLGNTVSGYNAIWNHAYNSDGSIKLWEPK